MVESASSEQRRALLQWALELEELRNCSLGHAAKAQRAIQLTARKAVLAPLVRSNLQQTQQVLWSDRGWPARLALLGLTVGTLGFSGKAAGIAAFGRAAGVPLWLVFAASGALLGALIEELNRSAEKSVPMTIYPLREVDGMDLEEREAYFRSLPREQLEKMWTEPGDTYLTPEELGLLKTVLREKKGIEPADGHSVRACPQCGMVGDNCTCTRSWF